MYVYERKRGRGREREENNDDDDPFNDQKRRKDEERKKVFLDKQEMTAIAIMGRKRLSEKSFTILKIS